jgi:hypothetical protein
VVTADHGLTFRSWPDQRTPEGPAMGDVAHVPLLVKAPGQVDGEVDESALMAVDWLPTLADLAGVDIPWPVAGHPAGSRRIAERDGQVMYDFGRGFGGDLQGVDRLEVPRPDIGDRIVGPREAGSSPVAGLTDLVGVNDLLDVPFDDLDGPVGGAASVVALADITEPSPGATPPGFVEGSVEGTEGARTVVVVAIDGTIVTAAPVDGDGRFRAMLPPAAVRPEGSDLRLVLVDDGGDVSALQIR